MGKTRFLYAIEELFKMQQYRSAYVVNYIMK